MLSPCRLYRHHVGTTGNPIGSTDLGLVYRYGFTGKFYPGGRYYRPSVGTTDKASLLGFWETPR
jgi:hypothetical protein